jgi:hypothetical protein
MALHPKLFALIRGGKYKERRELNPSKSFKEI